MDSNMQYPTLRVYGPLVAICNELWWLEDEIKEEGKIDEYVTMCLMKATGIDPENPARDWPACISDSSIHNAIFNLMTLEFEERIAIAKKVLNR